MEKQGLSQPLLRGVDDTAQARQAWGPASLDDLEAAAALQPNPSLASSAVWAAVQEVFEEPATQFPQSSLWDTTMNLTNSILGAGLLALPHAFAGLGVAGGVALIAAVGVMTHASIVLMLRWAGGPTERTGKLTYCAVMEHEWGRWAGAAVRFSIIVGSAGFLVLYLIVLADLLVGTEQYSGIIPDLWPQLPDPLPWYLQRTAMLTWVTLIVAPSLWPKTLGDVAPISVMKICCTLMCVVALVVLCVALAIQGHLPQVRWLPDPAFFGDGSWERLKNVLATIPVIMTA
ncbi:hypothetical protein CHLNCDRAFT_138809 [Chlorella variabilis]|uniref:Amino acid transporter transmembrane domain-containing protein n=1 Tax=Chlorella variabilis TaxID=554065 RepID=E1ZNT2_CHLVA|nr:hypothetical protein CHLNCDRAFT_138809 [Chlorella variabilis]EFN52375.1 hypothetical protein CHLNCDRAFT_138809 [Chlorella variabilis]|eukprot:XP_005844477.1 hypothetical protein CHLNCDRAFT_138809 [Chlorella variabilis]